MESRSHEMLPSTHDIMWPMQQQFDANPVVKEKMHLQENTLFDLGSKSPEMLPSALYIMWPMYLQSLKLLCQTVKEKMHLQENSLFDLWPGVKVTQNVAQYSLHHVPYSATKFEVATSNS